MGQWSVLWPKLVLQQQTKKMILTRNHLFSQMGKKLGTSKDHPSRTFYFHLSVQKTGVINTGEERIQIRLKWITRFFFSPSSLTSQGFCRFVCATSYFLQVASNCLLVVLYKNLNVASKTMNVLSEYKNPSVTVVSEQRAWLPSLSVRPHETLQARCEEM